MNNEIQKPKLNQGSEIVLGNCGRMNRNDDKKNHESNILTRLSIEPEALFPGHENFLGQPNRLFSALLLDSVYQVLDICIKESAKQKMKDSTSIGHMLLLEYELKAISALCFA